MGELVTSTVWSPGSPLSVPPGEKGLGDHGRGPGMSSSLVGGVNVGDDPATPTIGSAGASPEADESLGGAVRCGGLAVRQIGVLRAKVSQQMSFV